MSIDLKHLSAHQTALISFLERKQLKPHHAAKLAGITSSTLYNFIAGNSQTLSTRTLDKLAKATGSTVDEILGGAASVSPNAIPVLYIIGVYGKMFPSELGSTEQPPVGVSLEERLVAATISGDGLRPLPSGMVIFFSAEPSNPLKLIGKLCVVRTPASEQPLIREIHKGSQPGLYTLISWSASPLTDVEISAAHMIQSMKQPT